MKFIFVINETAGKKSSAKFIEQQLKTAGEGYDYEVYKTKAPGDAVSFVQKWCTENEEPVRFIACGGDGTLNEVVTGAVGFPQAEVSCYPCGSGNDFVKYYGKERFLDLKAHFTAKAQKIDLLRCGDNYSINIANFGFDAYAAYIMAKIKKKPIIGGKLSYISGVVAALFKAMRTKCTVLVDDKPYYDGDILLCTAANGNFVGGGFKCSPKSVNTDGLLDFCLVKPVSKLTLVRLITAYNKGTHLESPAFQKYLIYSRGKKMEVTAPNGVLLCLDGETYPINHFVVEIMEAALNFAVPE